MNKLRFIWAVSLVATLGSLYLSEVLHFVPCTLCWYQRILMYTLPIHLGIAMAKENKKIIFYTLPQTILGWFIALYHVLLQKTNWFEHINTCNIGVPCNKDYLNLFGFITIPMLSFIAFTLIAIFSFLILKDINKENAA